MSKRWLHAHHHKPRNYWDELFNKLDCLVERLCACLKPEATAKLGLHVSLIQGHGKDKPMPTAPPIKMLDVERVLLAVSPQKANGTPDPTVQISWSSSDPDQIGIDVLPEHDGLDAEGNTITIPATHAAWALTPLDRGAATITASATGYEADIQEISYEPGVPGRLNLSAGIPVPD